MSRKPLSKSVRFEVFKRDSFTCQYCGAKAPDVVLHVDHIHPVAEGGTNEIMNLVAACASCNGGKGAKLLDDSSAVERQRRQIEELQERREQLEMMLRWRDAEQGQIEDAVSSINTRLSERAPAGNGFSWVLGENSRLTMRRLLKRYSLAEVLAGLDEAVDRHAEFSGDGVSEASVQEIIRKIPVYTAYAKRSAENPDIARLAYIQGILRNRTGERYAKLLNELEVIRRWGVPLDVMEQAAKQAEDFSDYWDEMADFARSMKGAENGQN
jgi:hypothetical protein